MAKKKSPENDTELDVEDGYELEDIEQYDQIPSRQTDSSTKRRRIEELKEEKELRDSIYGDIY